MNIAIITPTFRRDLRRCEFLCQSVDRFVEESIEHYLIVDRRDVSLFQSLLTSRRKLLISEEILPRWLFRMPGSRRWWISLRSFPVRNWILQQILKLSINIHVKTDVYMFVDSDVFFIKPLERNTYVCDDKARLFRVPGGGQGGRHQMWNRSAGTLLGLELKDYYGSDFIGNMITWRRDTLEDLQMRIKSVTHQQWPVALTRRLHFSEYILYGVFSEFVQGNDNRHFFDSKNLCHCSWDYNIGNRKELSIFLSRIETHHNAVLIQSNLGLNVEDYIDEIERYQFI